MRNKKPGRIACLVWPFLIPLRLVRLAIRSAVRMATIVAGLLLVFFGLIASFTLIGTVIGIPVAVLGTLLLIRALF